MQPKLDIEATKLPGDDWNFSIRHSGSVRAGKFNAEYDHDTMRLTMYQVSPANSGGVSITHNVTTVADCFEAIADYFERHGALL